MHGPVSGGADVLLTDRLELRRWSEDDRRGWTELCRDPEVMRFIGAGVTWDADQIAAGFERNRLRWEQDGFGWRVDPRPRHRPIGGLRGAEPARWGRDTDD